MPRNVTDLDQFLPPDEEVIRYKGIEHPLTVYTTETYLRVLRQRERLMRVDVNDEAAMTEESIEMLVLVIPSLTREDFNQMPVPALLHLIAKVESELGKVEQQSLPPAEADLVQSNGSEKDPKLLVLPASSRK